MSVRAGRAEDAVYGTQSVRTAAAKAERHGAVEVTINGLAGDEQADLRVHGGRDKAICVYPSEHYAAWATDHGRPLPKGAFGENLVTVRLLEDQVQVGDLLRIGTSLTQVVAPRRPCWKLGARWSSPELPVMVQATGMTGFYLRVKENGLVRRGDRISLVERDELAVTVFELNRVMNVDRDDFSAARQVLETTTLPARWRHTLEQRLARGHREEDDARPRLYGR